MEIMMEIIVPQSPKSQVAGKFVWFFPGLFDQDFFSGIVY